MPGRYTPVAAGGKYVATITKAAANAKIVVGYNSVGPAANVKIQVASQQQ